ncbi:hypothetical protein MNBD_ALPHA01-845 [hydrothermal vent metagenome]|uniref:Uncharacterized protein n=1 Tax=hydrothermal vent metagenome TaxID=652676 RepID=A0A3B0SHV9_9ZZZZ
MPGCVLGFTDNIVMKIIGAKRIDINMSMDHHLENYSKIKFHGDLDNLERDVKNRIKTRQAASHGLKNFIEEWFGMPLSTGLSAVASMMILGVFLGLQMQTEVSPEVLHVSHDALGLEVFSATNAKLPSSMLEAKL